MSIKPSRIELDKHDGITIQLINKADGTVQTITMDGKKIKMEVTRPGGVEGSTIVQDAESVTIKCDKFVVDAAKTLNLNSARITANGPDGLLPADSVTVMTEAFQVEALLSAMVNSPSVTVDSANLKLLAATLMVIGISTFTGDVNIGPLLNVIGAVTIDGIPIP
jgi:hypothetical protein